MKFNNRFKKLLTKLSIVHSLVLFLLLLLLAGSSSADINLPGDDREPRCEKRSNTAPGRLNVDSEAALHGLISPCESSLEFYIARNTLMRSALGQVTVFLDRRKLHSYNFRINFDKPINGLFHDKFEIPLQENIRCSELEVNINSLECRDIEGIIIDCPVTRLKTSMVFKDLSVDQKAIEACFDN